MQYEYTTLVIPAGGSVVTELNHFGVRGWRLVQIVPDGPKSYWWAVFEKSKE